MTESQEEKTESTIEDDIRAWFEAEHRKRTYVPHSVICVVLDRGPNRRPVEGTKVERDLMKAMKSIIELMPIRVTGLLSEFNTNPNNNRVEQAEIEPMFTIREVTGKVVTKTCRMFAQFAQANRGTPADPLIDSSPDYNTFDVIFIEPNPTFTAAVDAWRLDGVYIQNFRGIDGERCLGGVNGTDNTLTFNLCGKTVKDTNQVLEQANKVLKGIKFTDINPHIPESAE